MKFPERGEWSRRVAESVVIGMVCFAPWAFGSVEAWAEFGLYAATGAVTILVAVADETRGRARRLLCVPSLCWAGLVLLAVIQVVPFPSGAFRWISPAAAALRADLLPGTPERVLGDEGPTVPLPLPRLSQNPGETTKMVGRFAAGWLLLQGVLGLGGGVGVIRRLAVGFTINAALLALFSIIQALTWNGRIFWVGPETTGNAWSVGGPFVCHTHLAEYLNLGLGMALGLAIPGGWRSLFREKSYRPWAAYAVAVIAAGIVASNSRGGFLAMLAAGGVLVLALRVHAVGLGLGAVAIVAAVAVLLAAMGDASPYLGRITTIVDPNNDAYAIRTEVWRGALRAWWAFRIWGTGFGSFPAATAPFLQVERSSFFARAENEYLDQLAEGGLVGIALMLGALVGVILLVRRAVREAADGRERGLILGAAFGLLALGFNSLSDFGPHIPGVGVPALILVATLCRLGLAADRRPESEAKSEPAWSPIRLGWMTSGVVTVAASLGLAWWSFADVRVESTLRAASVPLPNQLTPTIDELGLSRAGLERQRSALEAALRLRPDWADGHLWLGLAHLALYKMTAAEWLREAGSTPDVRASDPLWLLGVVHAANQRRDGAIAGPAVLEHEPVRLHLVPAARSFLEARRACLVSPVAQAELASLDYLLDEGDPASAYLARALRLAGNRGGTLVFAAEVAVQVGDTGLAARCWRRALEVSPGAWTRVADAAAASLSPGQILAEVIPTGRHAFQFAERLYADPEDRSTQVEFFRAAAARLPTDTGLGEAERLQLEARAWAGLDQPGPASDRMEMALALEPGNLGWRRDFIDWLLRWRRFEQAHDQARVGVYFAPESKAARETQNLTAEALARQESKP